MDSPNPDNGPIHSLSFMLTYRCTNSCQHCIVEAGPDRNGKMALGSALGWIDEAAADRGKRIRQLTLTGGEPFYDLQTLAIVTDHAASAGLFVAAETNAYWASSLEKAFETLCELPAIGKITIGTDVFHQDGIPIDHIHNAVIAAGLLGRQFDISVTVGNGDQEAIQPIISRLSRIIDRGRIHINVTLPVGRARQLPRRLTRLTSTKPDASACPNIASPVIFPDGRVMACMGVRPSHPNSCPLCLGNLHKERLAGLLDRIETDPLLQLLGTWGPHRLLSIMKSRGYGDRLPVTFLRGSRCNICHKLFSDRKLAQLITSTLKEEQA